MKNQNNFINFTVNKISIMLIILMSTAFLSHAANRKSIHGLPGKPETNDTVYPLQLTLTPHVYANGYNVSCFGFKDGSIDLTVTGGVPPYVYTWSEGDSTEDIGSLEAGYYKVVVTDADSNEAEAEITLTQPNQLQRLSINGVVHHYPNGFNVTCYGCTDGSINVSVGGGSGAYYYQWQDGPVTQDRTGLGTGQYAIIVRDSSECAIGDQANMGFEVKEPRQGSLQVNLTANAYPNGYNVSCFGNKDGSISSITTGGTPPYRYKWSTPDSTPNINNLPAGYYEVHVIDAHQIMTAAGITLTQPKPLNELKVDGMVFTYPNGYNVSCNSCFNGSIDVTVTGGSGSYLYQWRDSVMTEDRTELGAGEYVVFIKDASECSNEKEYRLDFEVKGAPIDGWSMDGNEGTDPESQFLGTTDSADFVLKTNNVEQLRLSPSNDSTGIGLVSMTGDGTVTNNFSVGNTLNVASTLKIDSLAGGGYQLDSTSNKRYKMVFADEDGKLVTDLTKGHATNGCLATTTFPWTLGGNTMPLSTQLNPPDYIGTCNQYPLKLFTFGQERMRIDANGNIGIGTTMPQQKLHVVGITTFMGNVGIGTTNPSANLHVAGNCVFTSTSDAITSSAYIRGNNDFSTATTPDYTWYNNDQVGIFHPAINIIAFSTNGTEIMRIGENGNVGIGTATTTLDNVNYKLAVNGKILAKEVLVNVGWSDFVFEKNYKLTPLSEVERYINEHKHLPNVPSADEVSKNGVAVGQTEALLLQKIEELTLYTIEISKQIDLLKKQNEELQAKMHNLQKSN